MITVISYPMRTHSTEDVTGQASHLNKCIVHHIKPQVLKIVAGKRKEVFYSAVCKHEDCNKLSYDLKETVDAWNKWNPNKIF